MGATYTHLERSFQGDKGVANNVEGAAAKMEALQQAVLGNQDSAAVEEAVKAVEKELEAVLHAAHLPIRRDNSIGSGSKSPSRSPRKQHEHHQVTISDADDAACDGVYKEAGKFNGRAKYRRDDGAIVYFDSGLWK